MEGDGLADGPHKVHANNTNQSIQSDGSEVDVGSRDSQEADGTTSIKSKTHDAAWLLKLGTRISRKGAPGRLAEDSRKAECNFQAHGPREALQLQKAASRARAAADYPHPNYI